MQTAYKNNSYVNDNLPETVVYPTDLIQFAKTLASTSHSQLAIEFRMASGLQAFSVNGHEPVVYQGYNFGYCAKLLIDELDRIGYFA